MKFSRSFALMLTVPLLFLAGCGRTVESPETTDVPVVTPAPEEKILTNVFAGHPFALPESSGKTIVGEVKPYYDSEAGTYTLLAGNKEGTAYSLMTFDTAGMPVSEKELPAADRLLGLSDGVICGNGVTARLSAFGVTGEMSNVLVRVTEDGGIVRTDDLSVLLGLDPYNFYDFDYAADSGSWTYLLTAGEVFVFDEQLALQFSVPCKADTLTAVEGTVYAGTPDRIAPIDKTSCSLGTEIPLPDGVSAEECFPGGGFALCWRTTQGIFGMPADGSPPELLLSFENSGLIPHNVDVLHAAGRDTFLLYDGSETAIYRRAEDIDLSDVTVIDLAYTGHSSFILQQIVEFNRSHPDIRIVTKDYNVYADGGSIRMNEESMLLTDMLTGVYQPDIFFTQTDDSSKELSSILTNGLFTDLYPLLEADGTYSRDDLFGCVRRTYETADGQLAAICPTFRAETLIGGTEILDGRTSWTLAEMTEYARSLPEGMEFLPELSARDAAEMLLGISGYSTFVNLSEHTCSFDSPEFAAYLDFLTTLPEKFDYSIYQTMSRRDYIAAGNFAVQSKSYNSIYEWMTDKFSGTPELTRIGYAADAGKSGSYIKTSPYVITSFCDTPEAAWTFVRAMLENEWNGADKRNPMGDSFPAMKSVFDTAAEAAQNFVYYPRSVQRYDPEKPPTEADGPHAFFTEEDADALRNWLDGNVGIRYSGILPDEVTDIVNEEISAYLAGTRDAGACADIIQSRVNIWLSEHK